MTEVGVRQAWPFVTFTTNDEAVTPTELRLYIDTRCEVVPTPSLRCDLAEDDRGSALPTLLHG